MAVLINGDQIKGLSGFIFFDNDFLGFLSNSEELLKATLDAFAGSVLMLDPLVRLEFLREVYEPKQRAIKEKFLEKLLPPEIQQEVFRKTMGNALQLSRLYAHKGRTGGASLTDLMLAGRVMMLAEDRSFLVTGNAKDFPSFIFETVSVINYEQNDGAMRAISVLKFSSKRYQECLKDYEKMSEKSLKK